MQQGTSSGYRTRTVTERLASGAGAWLPEGARRALRGVYNAVLARSGAFVCTLPDGEQVRVLPQHRNITWNPEEYAAFRAEVRPGDVVLDIGANLGAYTLLFGSWAGPRGHVYAFEPAPVPCAGLSSHVGLNGLADRVTVLQHAVLASEGTVEFRADGFDGENRVVSAGAATREAGTIRVPSTTIDAFCRAHGVLPRFIKIDAEGAELDVLRGGRDTIRRASPGLALYVEMHPHLWPGFNTSRAEIEAELAYQGLVPERIDGHPDVWGIEGVCLRVRAACGS